MSPSALSTSSGGTDELLQLGRDEVGHRKLADVEFVRLHQPHGGQAELVRRRRPRREPSESHNHLLRSWNSRRFAGNGQLHHPSRPASFPLQRSLHGIRWIRLRQLGRQPEVRPNSLTRERDRDDGRGNEPQLRPRPRPHSFVLQWKRTCWIEVRLDRSTPEYDWATLPLQFHPPP